MRLSRNHQPAKKAKRRQQIPTDLLNYPPKIWMLLHTKAMPKPLILKLNGKLEHSQVHKNYFPYINELKNDINNTKYSPKFVQNTGPPY